MSDPNHYLRISILTSDHKQKSKKSEMGEKYTIRNKIVLSHKKHDDFHKILKKKDNKRKYTGH